MGKKFKKKNTGKLTDTEKTDSEKREKKDKNVGLCKMIHICENGFKME